MSNMVVYRSEQSCVSACVLISHLNQRSRFTSRGSQRFGSPAGAGKRADRIEVLYGGPN